MVFGWKVLSSPASSDYDVALPPANFDQRLGRCLACRLYLAQNGSMAERVRQLEARLRRMERELAALKVALARKDSAPWYRQIVGSFAGDKAFAEIVRLGRLIRRGKLKG